LWGAIVRVCGKHIEGDEEGIDYSDNQESGSIGDIQPYHNPLII